ncbi:Na+/H+ antiporter [Pseudonocardia sulfidoxydans NBRC 16205]|uniref:Na+/H+ antiporter n=1 Tax=Pseudonocardia sulfidoxydans NBRC 16205 TaxID=1223511 RepID=A0A511DF82_9PSEU|nr:Na+/H+ antiporter [Pseudonocardia sulfidoxydans]GEL23441.1 Na+/H+ antiporter [Pseudonocardia sulfidoxydans NBRC 16205]
MPAQVLLVVAVLAAGVVVGRLVSRRTGLPEAAVFVLLGVGAAFVPGVEALRLSPDFVLLVFLPPLIYYAAFFSDLRETVRHLVPVVGQAVGLVVATAFAVAATLLAVFPDVGWAAAIAFGAAVAPPDPVAAGSVLRRFGVPRRMATVLEAEGLVNDGVALTLFAVAVGAVGAATTTGEVGLALLVEVGGGIGLGLVVGFVAAAVRRRIRDIAVQVLLSLLVPYLAFVPAQQVHASGVLATVTAAVWLGVRGRGLVEPTVRLHAETFWRVPNTLLVALLFVLLGVQVPTVFRGIEGQAVRPVVGAAVAVTVVVVVVRLAWVLGAAPLVSLLPVREEAVGQMPWRERLAVGWCGPRGAVSLAVVLSLPLTTPDGAPFPRRDLLVFLTVVVVLVTLVGQTLPLALLLRALDLRPGARERTESVRARQAAVDAALRELDGVAEREEPVPPGVDELRQVLELRRDHLRDRLDGSGDGDRDGLRSGGSFDVRALRLRLIEVERAALRRMHDEGEIGRETVVEISRELDLDEAQLRQRRH